MAYQIDKQSGDVVINGFEQGIADSQYEGISNLANININSIPNEATVNFSTQAISPPVISNGSVTSANTSTEYFTYTGAVGLENYMTIVFIVHSGLNVTNNVPYWIINLGGAGAGTFQLTNDYLQSSIFNVTGSGTGTFKISQVTLEPITGTNSIPKFFSYDSFAGVTYMFTDKGALWTNANVTTSGYWTYVGPSGTTVGLDQGAGIAYYQSFDAKQSYMFVFRNTTIDYFIIRQSGNFIYTWVYGWDPLTGTATHTYATLNTDTPFHNAYVGQDNVMYWCDGSFIGSLFETPNGPPQTISFDATSQGTVVIIQLANPGSSGYSTATNVSTSGGSGSGATVDITASGGMITDVVVHSPGLHYQVGDTLTITGGSGDATIDVLFVGSYTYAKQALALPTQDRAQCLAELGINLLIGGAKNAIYPWNRISTSFTYPILLAEYNVTNLVTVNTNTFIFVGNRGRIWITNGSQAQLWKKIPDFISGTVEPFFQWGGACSTKNQLYFSFFFFKNDLNLTTLTTSGGVWAIDLTTKALRLVNTLSYQTSTYNGYATCLFYPFESPPQGTGIYIGWYNTSNQTAGIDGTISAPYSGTTAVAVGIVDSDLVPIGTFLKPTPSGRVEFKLSVPLATTENVRLYYRQKFSDSFTPVGATIDSTTQGFSGYSWAYTNVPFQNSQWIQIRAVLTSKTTSPSFCRLTELRLGN